MRPTNELAGLGRFVFEIVLSGGKLRRPKLEDRDRPFDVLQPVLAEVSEVMPIEELGRRLREDDLAPIRRASHARGKMDVVAHVALVGHERSARMQADAEVDGARCKRIGHHSCCGYGPRCRGEGEEERVALRVDLDSALGRARTAHDGAVLGQNGGVPLRTELVQELRRSLHVGEEEGHGASRKFLSHAP